MLDFTPFRNKEVTFKELYADLTPNDLRHLTNEMVDTMLDLIADCVDADVTFIPEDLDAYDRAAATDAEVNMPWTLGHVIVHTTASGEESAFIAAELARGVSDREGRSRSEVPWETVTSIEQCRNRLEESRRMRLATLDIWPDQPHLDNTYRPYKRFEPINAVGRFVFGLLHDDSHLDQIRNIVRQAKASRST